MKTKINKINKIHYRSYKIIQIEVMMIIYTQKPNKFKNKINFMIEKKHYHLHFKFSKLKLKIKYKIQIMK